MSDSLDMQIEQPRPMLDKHSLFAVTPTGAQTWLKSLPRANISEMTKQVFQALTELNQVKCSPKDRLSVLEVLRPAIHHCLQGLEQHYLNKPIVLPEKARQVVNLANTLNNRLATGYGLVVNDVIRDGKSLANRELLPTALHRVMTEHGVQLLRHYQLYAVEDTGFWRSLHQCFFEVIRFKLTDKQIPDQIYGNCTLQQCYLRLLMLATANANELPQGKVAPLFNQLTEWSRKLKLRGDKAAECSFLFNPSQDTPPVYRELYPNSKGCLGVDTRELVQHLEQLLSQYKKRSVLENRDIDHELLQHLITNWSQMPERSEKRIPRDDTLDISLGVLSTHFFASGEMPFSDFTGQASGVALDNEDNPFLRKISDAWDANKVRDTTDRDTPSEPETMLVEAIDYTTGPPKSESRVAYRYYTVQMVNTSHRGYCALWPQSEAVRLRSGELLGIREKNWSHWAVGVLRWVKAENEERCQIGIEMLSSGSEPCSAREVVAGLASGSYHRALLLPADAHTSDPPRLLLPRSGFKPRQILELQQPGMVRRVELEQELDTNPVFSLFSFKSTSRPQVQEEKAAKTREPASGEFDNLWSLL